MRTELCGLTHPLIEDTSTSVKSPLKVALVHEWLTTVAGSERVVEQILKIYPQADLFTVVDFLRDDERAFLLGKRATTTFIQRLPGARKHYRSYLPLMPLAIEQLDLSAYDLVISSNHAVAKGVVTGPEQVHVCYVHSPMRYAWDMQHQYLNESGLAKGLKGMIARTILHYLRMWDVRTANGVDVFVANSSFIAKRIWKVYRREARVIYPPVDVDRFAFRADKEDFYLAASRMVPYKRMLLIIEAFAKMPEKRLIVIGDGPEFARAKASAGANVTLLGYQPNDVLIDHMQRARALVFAAQEDFGIMPVEAQACGTPVIAFGQGGSLETVVDGSDDRPRTGRHFPRQTIESIVEAVTWFDANHRAISADDCRRHAERFSQQIFRRDFAAAVDEAWSRKDVAD